MTNLTLTRLKTSSHFLHDNIHIQGGDDNEISYHIQMYRQPDGRFTVDMILSNVEKIILRKRWYDIKTSLQAFRFMRDILGVVG